MHFDHIDLRVRNLAAARALYDALLPGMGCTRINADEESVSYHRPDENGHEPFLWVVEDSSHRPNETRIAFAAASRADVNRIAEIARTAGARAFEPAALQVDYGPNYYAAFFEDADGNKIEICSRKPE